MENNFSRGGIVPYLLSLHSGPSGCRTCREISGGLFLLTLRDLLLLWPLIGARLGALAHRSMVGKSFIYI